jgi:signal transduction histidine kinase/ActR/RegA family two-component response regulator
VSGDARPIERRVLVLAPTGKDGTLVQAMLRRAGIDCELCFDVASLAATVEGEVGAMLVAEEAIANAGSMEAVADIVRRQPPWSDLPVLVLTREGADSPAARKALETLGNVTLLERPVRIAALASTVRTALRARERQYQTRAHLVEREEADHRKDEFLAMLSHELRNPLAPLRNAVQIMRQSAGGDPAAGKLCEMMERQLAYMVRLVDDLLEVSRITRGNIELRRQHVQLAEILAAAIETSRPLIEAGRHALTVSLPGGSLRLLADATRLSQVFANLLNNAAKYTDEGGRIMLKAMAEGDAVIVSVRDTGLGIPEQDLPRVFDMFAQVDGARGRAQGGLGIGLTLVRSLVGMHGGSVSAASDGPGKGSQFTVRLPLALETAPAMDEPARPVTAIVETAQRILIVDDNKDAADTLGILLRMLGAEVAVAHDGAAALAALPVHRPAVVFLDIGMPGMDGYEVARRIRQRPDSHDTTLIALSGWGQDRDRRESEAAGFDYHLTKPAEFAALRDVLQSVAARHA